jgi:hypothetical protein
LHARLFPAVAGKGELRVGTCTPRNCRPGTRQSSATSKGWLVRWPDSAPICTAPPPVIIDEPATAVALAGFIVRTIECGAVEQVAINGATVLIGRSWTCWPVGRLRDCLTGRRSIHRPQRGLRTWERNSPTSGTAGAVSFPHRPSRWQATDLSGSPARPWNPPGTAVPARPQTARDGPTVPPTRRTQATIDASPATLYISIRGRKLPQCHRSMGSRCTCGCSLAPGPAGRGRGPRSIRPVRHFPCSAGMVAAPTGAATMGAIRMDVPDAPEVDRPEAGRAGANSPHRSGWPGGGSAAHRRRLSARKSAPNSAVPTSA